MFLKNSPSRREKDKQNRKIGNSDNKCFLEDEIKNWKINMKRYLYSLGLFAETKPIGCIHSEIFMCV